MAKDPIKIDSDRLLLCEGKTTLLVLGPLLRRFGIQGFQPIDFGSKDNFGNFLKDLVLLHGFTTKVRTIAIVRDAEEMAYAAFAAVSEALTSTGLPSPVSPAEISTGGLRVGVFIVPDNVSVGMIETLCMRSVDADPAFPCVDQFFSCVDECSGRRPLNIDKARAQAFLATQARIDYHVGRAADDGVWNFEHAAFEPLVRFLRELGEAG